MLYPKPSVPRASYILELVQILIPDVVDEPGAQWQTSPEMLRKGREFGRLA